MIRIKYSTGYTRSYDSEEVAKEDLLSQLIYSRGKIVPLDIAEVLGQTKAGVPIERILRVKVVFE